MELSLQEYDDLQQNPRNVLIVALNICNILPPTQPTFKHSLERFINNTLSYKPPEDLTKQYNWEQLDYIMKQYISIPRFEWEKKVIDLYVGKTCIHLWTFKMGQNSIII